MLVGLFCVSVLFGQATKAAPPPDPREQLLTAIAHGIRLLETKQYGRFLQEFVSPLEMKEVLGSETGTAIDPETIANFAEQKAARVLLALREAEKATPAYEDNGQTAVYALKTPIGGRSAMAFTRVWQVLVHPELTRSRSNRRRRWAPQLGPDRVGGASGWHNVRAMQQLDGEGPDAGLVTAGAREP